MPARPVKEVKEVTEVKEESDENVAGGRAAAGKKRSLAAVEGGGEDVVIPRLYHASALPTMEQDLRIIHDTEVPFSSRGQEKALAPTALAGFGSDDTDPILLFAREGTTEPYSCFGQVRVHSYDLTCLPVRVTWSLEHFDGLQHVANFRHIVKLASV